jgi:hypothetical protein
MKKSLHPSEARMLQNLAQALLRDYLECKEVYGDGFEARMADLATTITDLQFESSKPGGISFLSAAILLLCVEDDAGDEPTPKEYFRDIRATMAWYSFEMVDDKITDLTRNP